MTATDTGDPALSLTPSPITVNLIDVNEPPVFSEGASASRSLPEDSGDNVRRRRAHQLPLTRMGNTLTY